MSLSVQWTQSLADVLMAEWHRAGSVVCHFLLFHVARPETTDLGDWGYGIWSGSTKSGLVIEHLPAMGEILSLIASTPKRGKKKKKDLGLVALQFAGPWSLAFSRTSLRVPTWSTKWASRTLGCQDAVAWGQRASKGR